MSTARNERLDNAPANDTSAPALAAVDDGETLSDWCRPRCAGGCHAGLVSDLRGPSSGNPTGLEPCGICG